MTARIGITSCIRECGVNSQEIMGVKVPYIESIIEAGGLPVIIPLLENEEHLKKLYDSIDGLFIPGGEDVHPKFYGETPHPKLGVTSELRDQVEIKLIRWAYEDNKPVLGVCRGIQVINVALGGTLIQDLDDQAPSELQHRASDSPTKWEDEAHQVQIESQTRLATIFGKTALAVNSLHHQAVKKVAPGLTMSAKASDGTVEAIEDKSKNFFMALQCHPEMMWQKSTDPAWMNLFKSFVGAAGRAVA